jgi:hypothetical protein
MSYVIVCKGWMNGRKCPHADMYVKSFDHEAYGGQGFGEFTDKVEEALTFPDRGAALAFWNTRSVTTPNRSYGDRGPNKPMTGMTILVLHKNHRPEDLMPGIGT